MTAIATLYKWFSDLKKPNGAQFKALIDSFWHKSEKIPMEKIEGLGRIIEGTASAQQLQNHLTDTHAHKGLFDGKVDKVEGKGLSSNDFTNAYKQQLDTLEDYDIELDENTTELKFKKGSNVIKRISLMFLDDEGTKLVYNKVNKNLELRDKRDNLLTSIPVSHFVSNIPTSIVVQNGKIKLMAGSEIIGENTISYNDLADKPELNYLPLTGGTVTGDINFNGDFLLFKDKTKVHVRDNGNIVFGNKPFNDLVIGEFKAIQLWGQGNDKVVLAGGGVKDISELKNENNLIEKTITNNEKVLESKGELPIKTRRNILTNNSGSRINLETLGNELTVTTHSGWARVQSNGYKIQGKDDNSVLTAGGNSKPLTQMFNDWYSTQGANIGTINTFKAYNNGTHKVDITGEGGILSVFKTNSSASSIELLVPGYGAHRLHFTHSIDNNRYAHPFKELAYFEDVYRPGIIRYDWDATKEHQNNTVFVNQSGYIELNQLENLSSMSFRKVFSNGSVEFRCSGKQIIYTGDNQFNGKDGSTAVVSIYENKCYIDIRNI